MQSIEQIMLDKWSPSVDKKEGENIHPYSTSYTDTKIKHNSCRPKCEITKVQNYIKENTGENIDNIGLGEFFSYI